MTSAPHSAGANQNPRPLTPERARTMEFSRAPITRRGYNEDEVQLFQYRVAETIAAADAEKASLREYIQRMKDHFREHGPDGAGPSNNAPEEQTSRADVASINVMSRAQQAADSQVAEAEEYARSIVAAARQQHEEILRGARQQAEEAAAAAAARQETDAADAAPQAPSDRDGHGPPVQGLPARSGTDEETRHIEQQIAYLRTFAEVTQVQLKSALDALSKEVDKLDIGSSPLPSGHEAAYAYEGEGTHG